jgi:hypothetical protein
MSILLQPHIDTLTQNTMPPRIHEQPIDNSFAGGSPNDNAKEPHDASGTCDVCAPEECYCYRPWSVLDRPSWSTKRWNQWISSTWNPTYAEQIANAYASTFNTPDLLGFVSTALDRLHQPPKRGVGFVERCILSVQSPEIWVSRRRHENAAEMAIKRGDSRQTICFLAGRDHLFVFANRGELCAHFVANESSPDALASIIHCAAGCGLRESEDVLSSIVEIVRVTRD